MFVQFVYIHFYYIRKKTLVLFVSWIIAKNVRNLGLVRYVMMDMLHPQPELVLDVLNSVKHAYLMENVLLVHLLNLTI
jgi:hypothetical protein